MPPEKIDVCVEQMHRAALAMRTAGSFAVQLRHYRFRRDAFGDRLAVLAIAGEHIIVWPQRRNCAYADGFLTDIEMAKPTDFSQAIRLCALLFKSPDQQHLMKY